MSMASISPAASRSSSSSPGSQRPAMTSWHRRQPVSRCRAISRISSAGSWPSTKCSSVSDVGWISVMLRLFPPPPRLHQKACQGVEAPGGDLADARWAVTQPLRQLGAAVPLAEAQPQQRTATRRHALEGIGQIAAEIGSLLGRRLGLGHPLEDRRVDRLVERTPALPPIQQALVAEGSEQPGLRVPHSIIAIEERQQGLLQDVLRILRGDLVVGEQDFKARTNLRQKALE